MTRLAYTIVPSPLGDLLMWGHTDADADAGADAPRLHGLATHPRLPDPAWRHTPGAFADAAAQVDAYFAGERTTFDIPLALHDLGTPFEREVWSALLTVPFGATTTYKALAALLGRPGAARAVGRANARNPVAIIVPCHRVIGSAGALTGYAGGVDRKRRLLAHEAAVAARNGVRALSPPWAAPSPHGG